MENHKPNIPWFKPNAHIISTKYLPFMDPPAIIYQEHPEDFPSYNGLTRQSYFMITEHVFPKLNWPESQNQSSFALPKVKNWNPKLAKSSGKLYRHIQTTDVFHILWVPSWIWIVYPPDAHHFPVHRFGFGILVQDVPPSYV